MAAQFIGTKKEFHKYIGSNLRNLVNKITREYKSGLSACQHCKSSKKILKPPMFMVEAERILLILF